MLSPDLFQYDSTKELKSLSCPGVTFRIRRISWQRRAELLEAVQEIAARWEYLQASQSLQEQVEAAQLEAKVEEIYLRWGLGSVTGLSIDGEPATLESLWAAGPSDLVEEIVEAIRRECGLSEEERKN